MSQSKTKLKIQEVDIAEVVPYDANPRRITSAAVDAVAASIKEYGFKNPILVDGNKVIIAGHTRLKAAKKLKLKKVPIIVDTSLTPEQVRGLRIIDNKSQEKSTWNLELLKLELQTLNLDQEVISLNFSPIELDTLLDRAPVPEPPHFESEYGDGDDDDDDEPVKKTRRKKLSLNEDQFMVFSICASKLRDFEPELSDGDCLVRICEEWQAATKMQE